MAPLPRPFLYVQGEIDENIATPTEYFAVKGNVHLFFTITDHQVSMGMLLKTGHGLWIMAHSSVEGDAKVITLFQCIAHSVKDGSWNVRVPRVPDIMHPRNPRNDLTRSIGAGVVDDTDVRVSLAQPNDLFNRRLFIIGRDYRNISMGHSRRLHSNTIQQRGPRPRLKPFGKCFPLFQCPTGC